MGRVRLVALIVSAAVVGLVGVTSVSATSGTASGVASSTSTAAIGLSVEGRPIDVACLGEGERTALFVGGLHTGLEEVGSELAVELAGLLWSGAIEVPRGVRVCVLPSLNPDGIALGLHTNARGVDLNRNWPANDWTSWAYHPETGAVSGGPEPLSEPETRALYEYIESTRPDIVVVFHCCGSLVEANSASEAPSLGLEYARAAGFGYIETWQLYTVTGQFIDAMDHLGVAAVDVELESPLDTALWRHQTAVTAVLAALGGESSVGGATSEGSVYIVRPGDTLANIAFRFGVNVDVLAWTNGIANPEAIAVGDVLTIPRD